MVIFIVIVTFAHEKTVHYINEWYSTEPLIRHTSVVSDAARVAIILSRDVFVQPCILQWALG